MTDKIVLPPKIKVEAERSVEAIENQHEAAANLAGQQVFDRRLGYVTKQGQHFVKLVGEIETGLSVFQHHPSKTLGYSCLLKGIKGVKYVVVAGAKNMSYEQAVEMGLLPGRNATEPLAAEFEKTRHLRTETNQNFVWLRFATDKERDEFEFCYSDQVNGKLHRIGPAEEERPKPNVVFFQPGYDAGAKCAQHGMVIDSSRCIELQFEAITMQTVFKIRCSASQKSFQMVIAERELLAHCHDRNEMQNCLTRSFMAGYRAHQLTNSTRQPLSHGPISTNVAGEFEEAMQAATNHKQMNHLLKHINTRGR